MKIEGQYILITGGASGLGAATASYLADKGAQIISGTKVLEKNGNKYTYMVNSLNSNASINDDQFIFDKKNYPGVEEVDLR